jgi:hypothetical protein
MAVDSVGPSVGDEGKGKIVDYLADRYQLVCRFQGGRMPVIPYGFGKNSAPHHPLRYFS